jgi:hypothetical protein
MFPCENRENNNFALYRGGVSSLPRPCTALGLAGALALGMQHKASQGQSSARGWMGSFQELPNSSPTWEIEEAAGGARGGTTGQKSKTPQPMPDTWGSIPEGVRAAGGARGAPRAKNRKVPSLCRTLGKHPRRCPSCWGSSLGTRVPSRPQRCESAAPRKLPWCSTMAKRTSWELKGQLPRSDVRSFGAT